MAAMIFRAALAMLGIAAAMPALAAPPADAPPLELAVKATYLVKIAPYIMWPPASFAGPSAPLTICIVGRDPFGGLIDDAAAGQHADQHPITVRRIDSIDRTTGCQIAFLGGSARQSIEQALAGLRGAAVVTVTDDRDTRQHGIVHFEVRERHVGFHIDDAASGEANLGVSSKLLGLALSVHARSHG